MVVKLILPFGKTDSVKNLVFTILTKEYPLRIIDLMSFIKKRYAKSVTFQAVRKAVKELIEDEVLSNNENKYQISKDWVKVTKEELDSLFLDLNKDKSEPAKTDSIGENISVFTFNSLNDLMKFWQDLIDIWFKNFQKGDNNINCYQAAHAWEGLLHIDKEKRLMSQLKRKGIKSYILSVGNSPLDKNIKKFYESIGIKTSISYSSSSFDKSYYVGTYGELVIQSQYPKEIVEALDKFFKRNRTIQELNLSELSEIANKPIEIKLIVIKNISMAKQINKSILDQF